MEASGGASKPDWRAQRHKNDDFLGLFSDFWPFGGGLTHFLFRLTQITKKQGFCPILAILGRFSSVFGVFEGILTHFFVFFRLFGSFQAEFGPNPHPAGAAAACPPFFGCARWARGWLFGAGFGGDAIADLVAGVDYDGVAFGEAIEDFGFEPVVVADLQFAQAGLALF